jgi:hypothetical protein
MAIRVDTQGMEQIYDAVATGSISSGALIVQENSGATPPWADRPNQSKEASIVSEAMRVAEVPADVIRQIKPQFPLALFPDERAAYDREPLTIDAVFDPDRWQASPRSWISGASQQIRRADGVEDMWSGTERNASSSVNPMM